MIVRVNARGPHREVVNLIGALKMYLAAGEHVPAVWAAGLNEFSEADFEGYVEIELPTSRRVDAIAQVRQALGDGDLLSRTFYGGDLDLKVY